MSDITRAVLLAVFILASCVWVGGYLAIAVVSRTAVRILEPAQRVAFFRSFGRSYLLVGAPALLVALGTGAGLLYGHDWDGIVTATAVVAAALVIHVAIAVIQARRMTRLRATALSRPQDTRLARSARTGAYAAAVLRTAIGMLSLTMIILGSLLAT